MALFQHFSGTVAGRYFTILTLVHQTSLDYKRGGWHRKTVGSNGTNTHNTPYSPIEHS
jgi:hypothetical protein